MKAKEIIIERKNVNANLGGRHTVRGLWADMVMQQDIAGQVE